MAKKKTVTNWHNTDLANFRQFLAIRGSNVIWFEFWEHICNPHNIPDIRDPHLISFSYFDFLPPMTFLNFWWFCALPKCRPICIKICKRSSFEPYNGKNIGPGWSHNFRPNLGTLMVMSCQAWLCPAPNLILAGLAMAVESHVYQYSPWLTLAGSGWILLVVPPWPSRDPGRTWHW